MTSRRAKRQRARKKRKDRDQGDTVALPGRDAFAHLAARTRFTEPGGVVEEVTTVDDRRAITKRVRPPVEVYFAQGKVTKRQYDAAIELYRCYAFGVVGVCESDALPGVNRMAMPASMSAARIDALTGYREAMAALDDRPRLLVFWTVCMEAPQKVACKAAHLDNKRAVGVLVEALDVVADTLDVP